MRKHHRRSTELLKELLASEFLGKLTGFDYEFGTAGGWAPLSGYNLARIVAIQVNRSSRRLISSAIAATRCACVKNVSS